MLFCFCKIIFSCQRKINRSSCQKNKNGCTQMCDPTCEKKNFCCCLQIERRNRVMQVAMERTGWLYNLLEEQMSMSVFQKSDWRRRTNVVCWDWRKRPMKWNERLIWKGFGWKVHVPKRRPRRWKTYWNNILGASVRWFSRVRRTAVVLGRWVLYWRRLW